jgi:hypothetical protein
VPNVQKGKDLEHPTYEFSDAEVRDVKLEDGAVAVAVAVAVTVPPRGMWTADRDDFFDIMNDANNRSFGSCR